MAAENQMISRLGGPTKFLGALKTVTVTIIGQILRALSAGDPLRESMPVGWRGVVSLPRLQNPRKPGYCSFPEERGHASFFPSVHFAGCVLP